VAAEAGHARAQKDVRKKTPYRDGWKGLDPEDMSAGSAGSRGESTTLIFSRRAHVRTRAIRL